MRSGILLRLLCSPFGGRGAESPNYTDMHDSLRAGLGWRSVVVRSSRIGTCVGSDWRRNCRGRGWPIGRELRCVGLVHVRLAEEALSRALDLMVFRAFPHELWADAFADGRIWLSTLETCRRIEDPARADPEEAREIYNSGAVSTDTHSSEHVREVGRRAGIQLPEGVHGVTLRNNISVREVRDAWVVCASLTTSQAAIGKFGGHVVGIRDFRVFLSLIHRALATDVGSLISGARTVEYRDNAFTGLQSAPGPLGFVKRPEFASENEFRFLWQPSGNVRPVPGHLRMRLPRTLFCRIR